MAATNHLIMDLLRIITPEEVGEITTKHNGGKFQSLTDLVNERVQKNIYRNFAQNIEQDDEGEGAKILPFKLEDLNEEIESDEESLEVPDLNPAEINKGLTELAKNMLDKKTKAQIDEHANDENMSSFILIEKARLKRSQETLKRKEVLELYQKNISVDVEQIRGQEDNLSQSSEAGVLVNKKQY
jgi:hypothetical protein